MPVAGGRRVADGAWGRLPGCRRCRPAVQFKGPDLVEIPSPALPGREGQKGPQLGMSQLLPTPPAPRPADLGGTVSQGAVLHWPVRESTLRARVGRNPGCRRIVI